MDDDRLRCNFGLCDHEAVFQALHLFFKCSDSFFGGHWQLGEGLQVGSVLGQCCWLLHFPQKVIQ